MKTKLTRVLLPLVFATACAAEPAVSAAAAPNVAGAANSANSASSPAGTKGAGGASEAKRPSGTDTAERPASAAKPSCCAAELGAAEPAETLAARSLYRLEAGWTDDAGRAVKLADLRGSPVALTLFFARCEYACPLLVHDLRKLREALPPAVAARTRFVLVTFDTERDTPEALKAYREAQGLDAQWILLRGAAADTQTLAMLLGARYKREATGQFAHSNQITILNTEGEIVHQRTGLRGDLAAAAAALTKSVK